MPVLKKKDARLDNDHQEHEQFHHLFFGTPNVTIAS